MQSDEVLEQKMRAVADDRVQRSVGLRLLVDVLDDRFDDDVARPSGRRASSSRRGCQACLLLLLGRHLPFLHATRQELLDARPVPS